jgi:hypothetical protein
VSKKSFHVVRNARGKWVVRKAGSARASSTHSTQGEAIASAKTRAKREKSSVFVHRSDGRIRDVNSYTR